MKRITLGYKTKIIRIKRPITASKERLYKIANYYSDYSNFNRDDIRSPYARKLNKERLERIALTAKMFADGEIRENIINKFGIKKITLDSYVRCIVYQNKHLRK